MASFSDLINITFEDAVTHEIFDNDDYAGFVLPFAWGPADGLHTYDRQEFFEQFPETASADVDYTNVLPVYAEIKQFFANGGSKVEIYRPSGAMTYPGVAVANGYYVTTKYPGRVPASMLPVSGAQVVVKAEVLASPYPSYLTGPGPYYKISVAGDSEAVIAIGQVTAADEVDTDGQTTFLPDLLADHSFLACSELSVAPTDAYIFNSVTTVSPAAPIDTDWNIFDDIELSRATILVSSLPIISTIAEHRKNCVSIIANGTNTAALPSRFAIQVLGGEKVKCFGRWAPAYCGGGVAGAYANIASQIRLNQVASGRTYGSYQGILTKNYTFSQVLDNSDNGFVTVYTSNQGPQIFGVHNTYSTVKSGSYFSKCNVSRVLADIIRKVLPMAMDAIHTDTAANAVTRAIFETNLNSILIDHIGRQNLQSDSKAICNEKINTDALTRGGQILNIILSLHFIGLVEKVNIKVVATDSSVNVELA